MSAIGQAKGRLHFQLFAIAISSLAFSSVFESEFGRFPDPLPTDVQKDQVLVFDGVRARAFEKWDTNISIPCLRPEPDWTSQKVQTAPSTTGLLMVKCYKTGSTTAASVMLRIAHNVARARNKAISRQPNAEESEQTQFARCDTIMPGQKI